VLSGAGTVLSGARTVLSGARTVLSAAGTVLSGLLGEMVRGISKHVLELEGLGQQLPNLGVLPVVCRQVLQEHQDTLQVKSNK